jgi:hypothetical protein
LLTTISRILTKLKIKAGPEDNDDLLPNLEAGQRGSLTINFWIVKPLILSAVSIDFFVARDTWYGGNSEGDFESSRALTESKVLEIVVAPSRGP